MICPTGAGAQFLRLQTASSSALSAKLWLLGDAAAWRCERDGMKLKELQSLMQVTSCPL